MRQPLSWEQNTNTIILILPLPGGWWARGLIPGRPELLDRRGCQFQKQQHTWRQVGWVWPHGTGRALAGDPHSTLKTQGRKQPLLYPLLRAEFVGATARWQPTGLPSPPMAPASALRPSLNSGFQNSRFTPGTNTQTHVPGCCLPPINSTSQLGIAFCESPGSDLTRDLAQPGALSSHTCQAERRVERGRCVREEWTIM